MRHRRVWPFLIAVALLALAGACCSGLWLMVDWGTNLIAQDIEQELATKPEMQESFGAILDFEIDWPRSMQLEEPDAKRTRVVYGVRGELAQGYVTVSYELDEDSNPKLYAASIEREDGRIIDIRLTPVRSLDP